jgi:hypothetical protein
MASDCPVPVVDRHYWPLPSVSMAPRLIAMGTVLLMLGGALALFVAANEVTAADLERSTN